MCVIANSQFNLLPPLSTAQVATQDAIATPFATSPAAATHVTPTQVTSLDSTPDQQPASSSAAQQDVQYQVNYPTTDVHSMPLQLSDRTHAILVKEEFDDVW